MDPVAGSGAGSGARSRASDHWPQPHPSPPPPPPRGYGAPGEPGPRVPGTWLLVAAIAVVVAVSVVAVVLRPGDVVDGAETKRPGAAATPATPGSTPSERVGGDSSAEEVVPAAYRCWDGASVPRLKDCTKPAGEDGLRWVFPAMATDRCGRAARTGGAGVVLRVLCLHRLGDGARIAVGYFLWTSVRAGADYYAGQGLTPSTVPGPDGRPAQLAFLGTRGDQQKAATLFSHAPFSVTLSFPASVTPTPQELAALAPRPPDQLRGAPAG